jgi:hypothetical protein
MKQQETKIVFVIQPHSIVDLITNSSTEIFTIQTNKTVEVVKELIDELQNKYPNEYGHYLSTDIASEEDIKAIYGYQYMDIEPFIKMMEDLGYVIARNPNPPVFITLSAERGGIDSHVRQFINENFNVIDYDTDR